MKTRIILILLAAVVAVSFGVIGKSVIQPKYTSADERTDRGYMGADSYQFN